MTRSGLSAVVCFAGLIAAAAPAEAQARQAVRVDAAADANIDPTSGPVVANAPFSADATTTVTQTLGDGTRIEQKTATKLYRDSSGRVRREQTVIGLDGLNASGQPQTVITFDSQPGDLMPYVLDPVARTASRGARSVRVVWTMGYTSTGTSALQPSANGWSRPYQPANAEKTGPFLDQAARTAADALNPHRAPVPDDVKPNEEQLGTRQMEGVKVTGRRTTTIIPTGRMGNDRPIQIVDERWESPELRVMVYSRFSDPRTGVVEYRLMNINRSEPRADLFVVPADYTMAPAWTTGVAAQRLRLNMTGTQPPQPGQSPQQDQPQQGQQTPQQGQRGRGRSQ